MGNEYPDETTQILNSIHRVYILAQLCQGPTHGYHIITQYSRQLNKPLSPSLIYPFLNQLETKGYLTHTTKTTKEKNRKIYKLTPTGKTFCLHLFNLLTEIFTPAFTNNPANCPNYTQQKPTKTN
jgi:DNA-binding PadR family transcriptional regulator